MNQINNKSKEYI